VIWVVIAAILPGLQWAGETDTASQLRDAGIERVIVASPSVGAWSELGFLAETDERLAAYTAVEAPSVRMERSIAAATSVPWVEANGWHFLRGVERAWYRDIPTGRAALAAAEAYSYGVDAVLDATSEDLAAFGDMLRFVRSVNQGDEETLADIGFVDDGTPEAREAMKLLERRNLLFRAVERADPTLDLNVQIGSEEYPRSAAADPHEFATHVRMKLTDQRRLLRIYGSDVVLGHVSSVGETTRVHLLNYGPSGTVAGLRVRVDGIFSKAELASFGTNTAEVVDLRVRDGGTEFTVPEIVLYAVVDLE
jgi:hypothetical protein